VLESTNITYALQYGKPILFFRDRMSEAQTTLLENGFNLGRASAVFAVRHNGLNTYLHKVLFDVISVASLFNDTLSGQTLPLNTFQKKGTLYPFSTGPIYPSQNHKLEPNVVYDYLKRSNQLKAATYLTPRGLGQSSLLELACFAEISRKLPLP
jgi:hypothetical protein